MKQPRLIARDRLSAAAIGLAMLCGGVPGGAEPFKYEAMEQLSAEPVPTPVTDKPQRAADAPANIEIITQDDIRRSGATSIPEVLQFVTGLDVRRTGFAST